MTSNARISHQDTLGLTPAGRIDNSFRACPHRTSSAQDTYSNIVQKMTDQPWRRNSFTLCTRNSPAAPPPWGHHPARANYCEGTYGRDHKDTFLQLRAETLTGVSRCAAWAACPVGPGSRSCPGLPEAQDKNPHSL